MRNGILTFAILLLCPVLFSQEPLSNLSVIKLVKAGLSEDLIVTTINSSPGKYDTSANGLIALKRAGATDKVVAAVVLKASGVSESTAAAMPVPVNQAPAGSASKLALAPATPPVGVDSIGVYYLDKKGNTWQEVPAEVVNFKAGGALKHYASAGVLKGDMMGIVGGNRSSLSLKVPASFILYVPEGRVPGEYQLLRLHENADSREFRAANGGIVHDAGGALRDVVDFTSKKIAPRVYLIEFSEDMDRGEYGFLPPSDAAVGSSIPTASKIYSFAVTH
jgi:predicted lipoprotein